jgi:hypothetical protein
MSQGSYENIASGSDYEYIDPTGALAAALESYGNLGTSAESGLSTALTSLSSSLDPNAALSSFLSQAGGVTDLVSGSTSDLQAMLNELASTQAYAGTQAAAQNFNSMGAGRSGAANRAFGEAYGNAFSDVEAQIAEKQLDTTNSLWSQLLSGQQDLQTTGAGAYSNLASTYASLLGTAATGEGTLASELGGLVAPEYEYNDSDWESFLSGFGDIGSGASGIASVVKLFFACIHPKSKITLANGKSKKVTRVRPGDMVLDGLGRPCYVIGIMKYKEESKGRFFEIKCNEGIMYLCDVHKFFSNGPVLEKKRIKDPKYSYDIITSGYKGTYQIDHVPVNCMIVETFKNAL